MKRNGITNLLGVKPELWNEGSIQSVGEGCVYKCRGPGGGECCREHKAQGSPAFPFSPLAALPSPHPLLGPFWGPSQTTGSFTAQIKSFLSVAATALHGPHLFRKGARRRPFDVLGRENREFTANQGMYVLGAGEMEREWEVGVWVRSILSQKQPRSPNSFHYTA